MLTGLKSNMRIKNIYKGDRPREKLLKFGAPRLKDSELLAIILGSGTKDKNVIQISESVIKTIFANKSSNFELESFLKINGIGKINAMKVISILELTQRFKSKREVIIYSPKEIASELTNIKNIKKEYFYLFCLDSRNKVIKKELVSVGTLNSSLVHPREVFEPAIRNLSAQIVIAHNHPSGDTNPSEEDLNITTKLVKVGELLGINILDHIVISKEMFFSFKEHNLL